MKRQGWWVMMAPLALGVTAVLLYGCWPETVKRTQHLADGSWLRINDVVFAGELARTFRDGNAVQRALERIVPARVASSLPWSLRSRLFPIGGAGLHLSGEGKACLFIISSRWNVPAAAQLDLKLMVVGDGLEQRPNTSNRYGAVEARHQTFQGWAIEDFPKDSKTLQLTCFAAGPQGRLVEVAQFKIRNPAFGGVDPGRHQR